MIGAVIGDLAGSIYEFSQVKVHKSIEMGNVIEENSFISDDTILTVAIADAILNKTSYEEKLKEYVVKYGDLLPKGVPYFKTMFSPGFTKWALGEGEGKSCGNGAMMRVSPVGFLFDTEEDVILNAYKATVPSHNTEEAVTCATTIALIIFYLRKGLRREEIIKKLNLKIKKPVINKFNYTCYDTIDVCLYSLFNSKSFEDCVRLVLSFGGDTDTNACIVCSMAEAMYDVREQLKEKALNKLPKEFKCVIENCYKKITKF